MPQTFTRPSGNAAYAVPAGVLPLDDTFKDTRVAVSGSWQQPVGETSLINVGASASKEYDYMHLGLNAKYARDFNQRNTTLSAGIALSMDSLDPVGGAPTPLTPMLDVGDTSNRLGEQGQGRVGCGSWRYAGRFPQPRRAGQLFIQQIGRLPHGPLQGSERCRRHHGRHTVADRDPGWPSHQFLYENRPGERTKHSIYGQAKYYMNGKVLDASYRYMTDDWEIDSHTVDLRYRIPFGTERYVEPHLRFYTQSEAEFYQLSIPDSQPVPSFVSADYRLGNFDAITAGLKYGWKTRSDNDMSVRMECVSSDGYGSGRPDHRQPGGAR